MSEIKQRLIGLMEYVEEIARLAERTVFSIRGYRDLAYFEHELSSRLGIQHNVPDGDDTIWLRIERLAREDPPEPPKAAADWLTVSREPSRLPTVADARMQTMSQREAEVLVAKGTVDKRDVMDRPGGDGSIADVRLRLDRLSNVKRTIDKYINGPWKTWSEREKPRRETMAIYNKFFNIHQAIETAGSENPLEVVLGVGVVLWLVDGRTIEHPLIEALVELEVSPKTQAISVRPRERDLQIYLKPFEDLGLPGASGLRKAAEAELANLASEAEVRGEPSAFSPFNPETFESVLRLAATRLSSTGKYRPDVVKKASDRALPSSENLQVTETWAIYVRPRSGNIFVQDVRRLKEAIGKTEEGKLPAPGQAMVRPPSDRRQYISRVNLEGGIRGAMGLAGDSERPTTDTIADEDILFPKPYNQAQIEVIRRLESSDGVVVQGPPGTGKTHTIANIICHYLAKGRSVLVTSKGEPALEVLRGQIPEEVQNLTISLLTSEREGLRQLERAVRIMANDVANRDPRQIEDEIVQRQREVVALRENLGAIDHEIRVLAERQLAPVMEKLCGQKDLHPADLARQIVEDRERHAWLEDTLGSEERFDPQFGNKDITEVHSARLKVGNDLAYLGCQLPAPQDLPDAAKICAIHQDLVQAEQIKAAADADKVPFMSTQAEDSLAMAEQVTRDLGDLLAVFGVFSNHAWVEPVFRLWLAKGMDVQETQLLCKLFAQMDQLVQMRLAFVERPVEMPDVRECHAEVVEALTKATLGKRPFGILGLRHKQVQRVFSQIRIATKAAKDQSDWEHVHSYLSYQTELSRLATRWNAVAKEMGLPEVKAETDGLDVWLSRTHRAIERTRSAVPCAQRIQQGIMILFPYGLNGDDAIRNKEAAEQAAEVLASNISWHRLAAARETRRTVELSLESCSGSIVEQMRSFLRHCVGNPRASMKEIADGWGDLTQELARLLGLRSHLDTVRRVAKLVEDSGASSWAGNLRQSPVAGSTDPWTRSDWSQSWRHRRLDTYLKALDGRRQLKTMSEQRVQLEHRLSKTLSSLVGLRTFLGLRIRMTDASHKALLGFLTQVSNMGTGLGVKAQRYRGAARRAMEACAASIPCWIMPTWRISEMLPSSLGTFDLVIVDEASQSDMMALPALLRAKKVLIVGDDRQVSPAAIGIEERKILQLRHTHLKDQPQADILLPGMSLYDLAQVMFPGTRTMLNEHFRCVEPIIRFSFQFYSEKITPIRIPKASERLDPPLIDIYLPHGTRNGRKINEAEAVAIVDEIELLIEDPAYVGRSIGVVSLIGDKQAHRIQNLLLERIGEDKFLEHRIACGNSATFQGKERDIMFISMVASPGQATALTARLFEQRFNVALSRARDRMYLFRSVDLKDLPNTKDLKRRVIEHFRNPMPRIARETEQLVDLCESPFERDVFLRLVSMGYRVTPQVEVGSFRIDLVVEGENDKRLGVELDGDSHHGPDKWLEDWSRQRIMERDGWRFWRCWYSSFIMDPEGCMQELVEVLEEMRIKPIGAGAGQQPYTHHRVVSAPAAKIEVAVDKESEVTAEIGDSLIIAFNDEPSRNRLIRLTDKQSDLVDGIVSVDDPAGKALLHKSVEDEVELLWDGKSRAATILQIEKVLAGVS